MTVPLFFLLFMIVALNSLAQIFMKAAALYSIEYSVFGVFNIWLMAAVACLGISFLFWQAALRQRPVSFLHPFCSLVYVIVPALSVLFFKETITLKYAAGICCIITGLCITSVSVRPPDSGRQEGPAC